MFQPINFFLSLLWECPASVKINLYKIYPHNNLACPLQLYVTPRRSIAFLPEHISCPFHKSWSRIIQLQSPAAPPINHDLSFPLRIHFNLYVLFFPFPNLSFLSTLFFLLHTTLGFVLRSDLCAIIETKINISGSENVDCHGEKV